MKLWPAQAAGGLLLAAVIGGVGWLIGEDLAFREAQKAHEALPLAFDPPAQPDSVGPIRVRFNCARRPDPGRVTVKVYYLALPNAAGRPYANETNEILLDAVYMTGRQGEVIEVPAKAMDRRVWALLDTPFGADVSIAGQDGLFGTQYVSPGDDMTGVIDVSCRDEWKAK